MVLTAPAPRGFGRGQRHLVWLVSLTLGLTAAPSWSQAQVSQPEIPLRPGFQPNPLPVSGVSGGSQLAREVVGTEQTPNGRCLGYLSDTSPDHILVLEADFPALSLWVESRQDTTLVIQGDHGVWCNDDYQEHNPGLSGEWLQGEYQIWVGSYQQDRYYPYTLYVRQDAQNE